MRAWRSYRFPPLLALTADTAEPGAPQQAAEGFQRGMDAGLEQGYAAGLAEGREAGYAAGLGEGREQGRDEGRRAVLAELDGAARPLEAAAAALERLVADYQAALRGDVVELVAKVARQVIRCELALRPAQLLDLVEEALAALPSPQAEVEVVLNAEECARIRELAPERAERWRLVPDAALPHGECRIRTADSEVDAGCQQRLAACVGQLEAQLLEGDDAA